MTSGELRVFGWVVSLGLMTAACGSDSGEMTAASGTSGSTTETSTSTTTGPTSSGPEPTSSVSATGSTSTPETTESTTESVDPTNGTSTSGTDTTTGITDTTTGTDTDTGTSTSTSTGTDTTDTDTDTGTSTGSGTTDTDSTSDSTSSTGDTMGCVPTEMSEVTCDQIDNDCDGKIDNVDVGGDGFCDCYRIGIIGTKGANPAANFEAWLMDKGTTATRFGTAANHQLTEQELDQFDILIIDRLTHVYTPEERALLTAWIEAGHGVITMAGYTNTQVDVDRQNSLASATTLAYSAPIYLDPVEVWQNHPIADGAQGVAIYGGWRVVGDGEVFVRPQGEPDNSLGTALKLGEGAAIVFSDEWISFDSEWQAIPQVPVFWSNMIEWVGPKSFCAIPQ